VLLVIRGEVSGVVHYTRPPARRLVTPPWPTSTSPMSLPPTA